MNRPGKGRSPLPLTHQNTNTQSAHSLSFSPYRSLPLPCTDPSAPAAAAVATETDPERVLKLKECTDLLLAGGYFRARIPTLSPFDKVVGGLAWSITASGVDVDVDVIFSENSSIGAKIRTSDQIVRAMVAMRCPYPLQSHQIQGLDYVHLFPIIQWLVRKVIETRRLTGDSTRLLSVHQFGKSFRLPEEERREEGKGYVLEVVSDYRPQRKFRRKQEARFDSVERRTEATLLEYGEKISRSAAADEEAEERRRAAEAKQGKGNALFAKFDPSKSTAALEAKAKEAEDARRAAEQAEAARYEAMQQQMAAHEEVGKLSGANVGSLVGRQADEIRKAMAEYEEKRKKQEELEAEMTAQGKGKGGEAAFNRQLEAAKKRLAAIEEATAKKKEEHDQEEKRYRELQAETAKKVNSPPPSFAYWPPPRLYPPSPRSPSSLSAFRSSCADGVHRSHPPRERQAERVGAEQLQRGCAVSAEAAGAAQRVAQGAGGHVQSLLPHPARPPPAAHPAAHRLLLLARHRAPE